MQITKKPLKSVFQTGEQMKRLCCEYYKDISCFNFMTLGQYFNFVKDLPYLADPKNIEFLSRPGASLLGSAKYRDCDDKAILIGSYLILKKIPFRFIAVSTNPAKKIHHVLVEAQIKNCRLFIDATYPKNKLFELKRYTKKLPITDWIKAA